MTSEIRRFKIIIFADLPAVMNFIITCCCFPIFQRTYHFNCSIAQSLNCSIYESLCMWCWTTPPAFNRYTFSVNFLRTLCYVFAAVSVSGVQRYTTHTILQNLFSKKTAIFFWTFTLPSAPSKNLFPHPFSVRERKGRKFNLHSKIYFKILPAFFWLPAFLRTCHPPFRKADGKGNTPALPCQTIFPFLSKKHQWPLLGYP